MRAERNSISPALLASLLLHGGLAASVLIAWPWASEPIKLGSAVPVTIVTEGPPVMQPPAELAPEEVTAQAPEPEPLVTPEPPAPPQPAPTPKPSPKPSVAPKAAPSKPSPKPRQELDLDKLLSSIPSKPRKSRPPSKKGPAQAETARTSRPISGAATDWLATLSADLGRRWNPNCGVEGGTDVDIKVSFIIGASGRLTEKPVGLETGAAPPMIIAARDRAILAVGQAAPFEDVPSELYGQRITVTFNAQKACNG